MFTCIDVWLSVSDLFLFLNYFNNTLIITGFLQSIQNSYFWFYIFNVLKMSSICQIFIC